MNRIKKQKGQAAIELPAATAGTLSMRGQAAIESNCGSTAGSLRGQAAMELLAYASFFLLTFVVVVAMFFQMQSQELSRAESSFAQETAYQFADDINTAHIAGSGFWQKVVLPPGILGKNYNVTVSRRQGVPGTETGFVYIDWQGASGRQVSLSAPTITGAYDFVWVGGSVENDSRGFIAIYAKELNISNINGTIWIKKA